MKRAGVLVFAGSDPSCGAGIGADILAIAALGAHPLAVITALTAQDNDRVFSVHPVAAALLQQQTQPLIDKIGIAAVKIGIVGNRANAEAIAQIVAELKLRQPDLPVVLDPVLASGRGDALAAEDAVQALTPLLSLATLLTPNLPEAAALCAANGYAGAHLETQAQTLLSLGCRNVLIKGGHGCGDQVVNRWFGGVGEMRGVSQGAGRSWTWPRLAGGFHGSGCTLAAALAALLASGKSMADALDLAQAYCHRALANAYSIADGQSIPSRLDGDLALISQGDA